MLSGCNILDNDDSTNNFEPIRTNQLETFMQGYILTEFVFEIEDDSGNVQIITDSLRYTWVLDSLWFNTYSESSEELLDSLESEYTNNPYLVLSQEQLKVVYSISIDSTTIIQDSTFTFISENNEDTTRATITSQGMDILYAEAGFSSFEKDTIVVNNFNLNNDRQNDSYSRFNDGIQFAYLEWLPDSTFTPNVSFFRIEGNTVIFGAYERTGRTQTYNLMQNAVIEQYRSFIEQL
jgi:hypothetical protein